MRFTALLQKDDNTSGTFLEIPAEVMDALGGKRVAVRGEINGVAYRAWAVRYRGIQMMGLRADQREAMGITAGDTIEVEMEPDTEERVIEPPADLADALASDAKLAEAWDKLPYSHKREHADAIASAKKPETREKRLAKALEMLRARG